MPNNKQSVSPRVRVIQKLYGNSLNSEAIIEYPKSQYKKFIKDVVQGTIERNDFIEETVTKYLAKDIDLNRADKLLKIIDFKTIVCPSFLPQYNYSHPIYLPFEYKQA